MRKRCKTRLCLLLALCMAALFLPQSLAQEQPGTSTDLPKGAAVQRQQNPTATDPYDKAVYSENDVNVINAIIANNGLGAQKDDPANWGFAGWNNEKPKRITTLSLYKESLTGTLDVRGLTGLQGLECDNNQLSSLELGGQTGLTYLICSKNQLSSLDVRGLTGLQSLDCSYNQLSSLELSGLTALKYLDCYNNQLTSLELSGQTGLLSLYCYENQLSSLELSGQTGLEVLDCSANQLSSLDVSGLTGLKSLQCYSNQITSLELSSLTALLNLKCAQNPLASLAQPGGRSIAVNVTGNGQPWLENFVYQNGQVKGTYTSKPAAGYGNAVWSNPVGCTVNPESTLSFDFASNGNEAAASADLTFTRIEPIFADPDTGKIIGEGVQPGGQVQKGSTFTFTANPIETGAPYPIYGDTQYMPESWKVNPSGDFVTGYTQSFSTADMALGDHTLTVTYRMQRYDKTAWEPLPETIDKTFNFTLVEQVSPPITPPEGNTPIGGQNVANGTANPGTGDSGYAWYILGLALAGGAILLLSRKKKTA